MNSISGSSRQKQSSTQLSRARKDHSTKLSSPTAWIKITRENEFSEEAVEISDPKKLN